MWCGGFGSADWFHNYVENLTFDVGAGNPGRDRPAVLLEQLRRSARLPFHRRRGQRRCRPRPGASRHERAVARAELRGHRLPARHRHSAVGQRAESSSTSRCADSAEIGFKNEGQTISIRGLTSDNAVPARLHLRHAVPAGRELTGRGERGEGTGHRELQRRAHFPARHQDHRLPPRARAT